MPSQRSTQSRGPGGGSAERTVMCPQRSLAVFGGTQRLRCSGPSPSRQPRVRLRPPCLSAVGSGQRQASEAGTGALSQRALPVAPGGATRTLSAEQRCRTTAGVRRARPGPRGNGGPSTRLRCLTSPLPQRMQAARRPVTGGARVLHRVGQLARPATTGATARCPSRAGAVARDLPCVLQLFSHRHHAVGGGRYTLSRQVCIAWPVDELLQCSSLGALQRPSISALINNKYCWLRSGHRRARALTAMTRPMRTAKRNGSKVTRSGRPAPKYHNDESSSDHSPSSSQPTNSTN